MLLDQHGGDVDSDPVISAIRSNSRPRLRSYEAVHERRPMPPRKFVNISK
jgi:hypothetical protein